MLRLKKRHSPAANKRQESFNLGFRYQHPRNGRAEIAAGHLRTLTFCFVFLMLTVLCKHYSKLSDLYLN
jgi:hypothetical protein